MLWNVEWLTFRVPLGRLPIEEKTATGYVERNLQRLQQQLRDEWRDRQREEQQRLQRRAIVYSCTITSSSLSPVENLCDSIRIRKRLQFEQ